ncbi:MAG: hypothetical protein E7H60_23110 [Pseudomonas oryzihabitans]|nr:hypothetical protein [Pseudomonas oryzihabitans]MDU4059439.1 hypothetical protein [Pseudomonas oryzihabitans]
MPENYSKMPAVKTAAKRANVFLLPPHEENIDRQAAQEMASEHLTAAIECLVRAGLSDTGLKVLRLAHQVEGSTV